jgi:pilus assembly protein CpaF
MRDLSHVRRLVVDAVRSEAPSSVAIRHDAIRSRVRTAAPLLEPEQVETIAQQAIADLVGLGPLQPYLDDDAVTDVMVVGGRALWVERSGVLERVVSDLREEDVMRIIERIVSPLGLRVDRSEPMVDARLPDGSRVHVVLPPLAVDGPCLTVRRFRSTPVLLGEMATPGMARFLVECLEHQLNIVISGKTGSGKTTLLGTLLSMLPESERIVTIEDAVEVQVRRPHVVRLEARRSNSDGVGEVTIRDLVRNALRMRPDRLVVGEVRGAEALDMLQAMSTGHDGSLSTCHARSPSDALRRIETMASMSDIGIPLRAVRQQIVSALDVVVQMDRSPDGARRVVSVMQVVDGPDGPAVEPIAGVDVDDGAIA